MTKWKRFSWALGYTLLTLYGVFVWITLREMQLYHYLGASSMIYGLGLAGFSQNDTVAMLGAGLVLLILAGLLIVPVLTAFRLRLPLYMLMGIDVLGRALLIVEKLRLGDMYLLLHIILGLIVSIGVLAMTVYMFRRIEDTTKEDEMHANA
ncbi:MAG: hypothetical protein IJ438_06570 [Clostridia bacterium]|nr:hypothetical protein [Clostridia bacterium]